MIMILPMRLVVVFMFVVMMFKHVVAVVIGTPESSMSLCRDQQYSELDNNYYETVEIKM